MAWANINMRTTKARIPVKYGALYIFFAGGQACRIQKIAMILGWM
jgi:hypothetical protein